MAHDVLVLNGPNLGRLGSREPEIYGDVSYARLSELVSQWGNELGLAVQVRQSDDEATLISWLHEAADLGADVVINPAAFTHYSYGLRDAAAQVSDIGLKLIEIHLTNPATREKFRHHSVISGVATGTIAGFGLRSYELALRTLADEQR